MAQCGVDQSSVEYRAERSGVEQSRDAEVEWS